MPKIFGVGYMECTKDLHLCFHVIHKIPPPPCIGTQQNHCNLNQIEIQDNFAADGQEGQKIRKQYSK